jgi:predicted nucleotidyltransferase
MQFSEDMKALLSLFEKHRVRYVLVGGHAVNYYGYVRTTQDMNVLVYPSSANATRLMGAIEDFGFSGAGIPRRLFEGEGGAVHLGVEPNRIDILTSLVGASNDEIFANAEVVQIDDLEVRIISLEDLLRVKRGSKRPRDQADADELSKIKA